MSEAYRKKNKQEYSDVIPSKLQDHCQEDKRQYVFQVGNINKSTATMVDLDYNLMEMPKYMLPHQAKPGSIIRMVISQDLNEEKRRQKQIQRICRKVSKGIQTNNTNKVLQENQQ